MAKALNKKQPMSSVERFFSGASMDGALAPREIAPSDAEQPPVDLVDASRAAEPAPEGEPVVSAERVMTTEAAPPPAAVPSSREKTQRAPIAIVPPRAETNPARNAEPVDRQREFQLTRSADETLEDLILAYRRATGAEVTRSHVLRAMLKAIAGRMPELKREAQAIGPLRRPSNAKGFEEARDEFEDQIRSAFLRGLRDAS